MDKIPGWLWLVAGVSVIISLSAAGHAFFGKTTWVEIPFHSALEASGAVVALVLAILLTSTPVSKRSTDLIFMICSLVGLGVLDAFHSFVGPGEAFVWLHSLATAVGGVLAAGALLPLVVEEWRWARRSALIVAAVSFAIGVVSTKYPAFIPLMIEDGTFTSTAVTLNVAGGVFYLAAAVHYFMRFRRGAGNQVVILGALCAFLGVAGILFKVSGVWDVDWWLWHLIRVFAFVLALGYITSLYRASIREVEEKKELEELLTKLQAQQEIIRQKEWVSAGRLELGDLMRGDLDVNSLAEKVMGYLAPYLGAQVGALYVENGPETLVFAGGYAYRRNDSVKTSCRFGEGLLGQAALDGKPIIWDGVPDDYVRVSSGLVDGKVTQIVFYPLIMGNQVKGVIELGAMDRLDEEALEFLSQVSESIAVSLQVAST